jgi:hypothetical protein
LNYFKPNINNKHLLQAVILLIIVLSSACNPTKYIHEDESLLDKSDIKIDNNDIKKSELTPYIKQSPNKKIFGARFHLGLYNLSNIEKDKWPHAWLRRIGEEPVVFDPFTASKSSEQIENYLFSKGYFNATVDADYFIRKKRANIIYDINASEPYRIRNISYNVMDTTLRKFIFMDSVNCIINRGEIYDVDRLQAERLRVERLIKDLGFYGFSRDNINFRVDSTIGKRRVDIEYHVNLAEKIGPNNRITETHHKRYRINNVFIYPDFDPRAALEDRQTYFSNLDTTVYNGIYFISDRSESSVKKDVIIQSLYIKPGELFQVTNTEQSQGHLSSLQAFGRVNIRYSETDPLITNARGEIMLNCVIQITPVVKQAYRIELEGTNSAGNLGGAVNLVYQHKNLFRGAEQLNMKIKGSYEALEEKISGSRSTQEYGFETTLTLPRFLFPFLESEKFIKKYNPKTTIQSAYNYQKMPVYTRTVANATFGYKWKSGNFKSHSINPLQLNVVSLPYIDP